MKKYSAIPLTCMLIAAQVLLPIQAFATIPVADVGNVGTHAVNTAETTTETVTTVKSEIVDNVLDAVGTAVATTLINVVVQRISNWASSGFEGNPFYVEDLAQDFKNIGLQQYDYFVSQVEATGGPFSNMLGQMAILGSPYRNKGGAYTGSQFTLDKVIGSDWQSFTGYQAGSTSGSIDNLNSAISSTKPNFLAGGQQGYRALLDPANNTYGAELLMRQELSKKLGDAQASQQYKLSLGQGFLGVEKCVEWADPEAEANAIKQNNDALMPQSWQGGADTFLMKLKKILSPKVALAQEIQVGNGSGYNWDTGGAQFGGESQTDPNQVYANVGVSNEDQIWEGGLPTAPSGQPSTATKPRVCKNSITQTPAQVLKDQLSNSIKAPLDRLGVADKWQEVISSAATTIITSFIQGGIKRAADAIQEATYKDKQYEPVHEGLTGEGGEYIYTAGGSTVSGPSSLQYAGTNDADAVVSPDVIVDMDEQLYGPRVPVRDADGLLVVENGEVQYEKNADGTFKRNNDLAAGGSRGGLKLIEEEVRLLEENRDLLRQFPAKLEELDKILPGPDYKWQNRLDDAFQREFQKTQLACAKKADESNESWQCEHMRKGPYEIAILKQMILEEMLSPYWNIPSAQRILDTVNTTGRYQNAFSQVQSTLNDRRRVMGRVQDIAARYSSWNAQTTQAEKAQLYREYLSFGADLPADQMVDRRRNDLEKDKIEFQNIQKLIDQAKIEVNEKAVVQSAADPAAGDQWRLPFGVAYLTNQAFCYLHGGGPNDNTDEADEDRENYEWALNEIRNGRLGPAAAATANQISTDTKPRSYPFPKTQLFDANFDDKYFVLLYRDDRENIKCSHFYTANPQDYIGMQF